MNTFDWHETIDPRIRARKDRLAFFLSSVSMTVTGLYLGLFALAMLSMDRGLWLLVSHPKLDFVLGIPLMLANLFAAVLFLGASEDDGRGSRAAMMLLITLIIFGFWGAEHARWLGFDEQLSSSAEDPIRSFLLRILGVARVILLADVALVATRSTRHEDLSGLRRGVIAASLMGCGLWLMWSLEHINWQAWPLRWRIMRDIGWFLILTATFALRSVSCLFAAILCAKACSLRSRELAQLEAKAIEDDPFGSNHPWH